MSNQMINRIGTLAREQVNPARSDCARAAVARAGGTARWHQEQVRLLGSGDLADDLALLRFVPALAERTALVTLEVPHALQRLAASVDRRVKVVAPDPRSSSESAIRLDSLPDLLPPREIEQALAFPYVNVSFRAIETCEKVLDKVAGGRPRVGIAHCGSMTAEAHAMAQAFALPGIAGIPCMFRTGRKPLGVPMNDLADAAALIECLDLLLTSDPQAAALAGALGKPAWLLDFRASAQEPDFRLSFPSVRLFHANPHEGVRRLCDEMRNWYNDHIDALLRLAA